MLSTVYGRERNMRPIYIFLNCNRKLIYASCGYCHAEMANAERRNVARSEIG
jgi:hypothetical protein